MPRRVTNRSLTDYIWMGFYLILYYVWRPLVLAMDALCELGKLLFVMIWFRRQRHNGKYK